MYSGTVFLYKVYVAYKSVRQQ